MRSPQFDKLFVAASAVVGDVAKSLAPTAADASKRDGLRRNAIAETPPRQTNPTQSNPAEQSQSPAKQLSPRQRMAVELLLAGRSASATARALGVHPATLFRWKADPRFAAEIDRRIVLLSRDPARVGMR